MALFEMLTLATFEAVLAMTGATVLVLVWVDLVRVSVGRRSPLRFLRRPRYKLQHAAAIVLAVCVLANLAAHMQWRLGAWTFNIVLLAFSAVGVWLMVCLAAWMFEDYTRSWRRRPRDDSFDERALRGAIAGQSGRRRKPSRLRIRLSDRHRRTVAVKRF